MSKLIPIFLLLAGFTSSFGQEQEKDKPAPVVTLRSNGEAPRQIAGGVLNGKATSLPKPSYPPAARAVGADGPVTVQVLIDVTGDVISATAVSGHPLLRAAATEAARGAKFSPTFLDGVPVKVSGVITYNFVGPLTPGRVGYSLAYAEVSGSFDSSSNALFLAGSLPDDWSNERELLRGLTFEKPVPIEKPQPEMRPESDKDQNRYTAIAGSASTLSRKLDARSVDTIREVMSLLATRFADKESAAWSFELGRALGELNAKIDNPSELAANVVKVESIADRAPATISPAAMQQVREFIAAAKIPGVDTEELRSRAQSISRRRY